MEPPELPFAKLLRLKDGSLAIYEGADPSSPVHEVKLRLIVIRFSSVRLGAIETVAAEEIDGNH